MNEIKLNENEMIRIEKEKKWKKEREIRINVFKRIINIVRFCTYAQIYKMTHIIIKSWKIYTK